MMRRFKIIFCFGVCIIFWTGSRIFAAPLDPTEHSVDELSHGLESLVDSSNQLVQNNDDLTVRNQNLKRRVDFLERTSRVLEENNVQLEKDLAGFEEKNKNKHEIIEQNQVNAQGAKNQMINIDQQIAMKKIALAERQKQQKYIFELLTIADKGGSVDQDIQMVKDTQTKLARQVNDGQSRLQDLENKWKELSFWYGDVSISMPKLKITRDQLKAQLDDLKKTGISERWSRDQNQIHKLDGEIKGLVKQRSSYLGALKVIENKYIGGAVSTPAQADEQKLQANLRQLKKDNKGLQRQVTDLRLEMVGLDKKKSGLENILSLNK
jgi:chromosome segregation ATPase